MNIESKLPLMDYQATLKELGNSTSQIGSPKLNPAEVYQQEKDFNQFFEQAFNGLESKINKTETNIPDSITGKTENLHDVMIDMTEAQLSLQTAIQIRNKMVEAVNDLKNMQF
ncbi:flagellar hook-basal body complex protein FliE [Vagococcus silagei]|nr:flagellar hook-basal body complex protein FliE [Vagococcus silagei]